MAFLISPELEVGYFFKIEGPEITPLTYNLPLDGVYDVILSSLSLITDETGTTKWYCGVGFTWGDGEGTLTKSLIAGSVVNYIAATPAPKGGTRNRDIPDYLLRRNARFPMSFTMTKYAGDYLNINNIWVNATLFFVRKGD
jgi:hypothetical protein